MDQQLIDRWQKNRLITAAQAEVMRQDLAGLKKEKGSQDLISTVSTLGAGLLGLGVLVFIASNWSVLPAIAKILLMVGSTLSSLLLGYLFGYHWRNLPRVGTALVLLSGILYGATLFLVAQIYHINAHSHVLILLWLLGVLPLTYFIKTQSLAVASAVLFYVWLGFFAFRSLEYQEASVGFYGIPILMLSASTFLFAFGGLHWLKSELKTVGRIYKLGALQCGLVGLFLVTFEVFSGKIDPNTLANMDLVTLSAVLSQFNLTIVVFSALSYLTLAAYWFLNPAKSKYIHWEVGMTSLVLTLGLSFLFSGRTTDIFTFVFNGLMIAAMAVIVKQGYEREDLQLVNVGMFFIGLYVLARYVDWFWDVFPQSLFFMIGGLILVGGGVILERQLKAAQRAFKTKTAK